MKTEHKHSLKHHFLIATPSLQDPLFGKSLTYICDHGPDGAMGLIVNRPMELNLKDILEQMAVEGAPQLSFDTPILAGGPVHTQRGFVLHTPDDHSWDSSILIDQEVALTASKDIVGAIAQGDGPTSSQFILGYAGWNAGQLEEEIKENSWLTVPANLDILFNTPAEKRWGAAADLLGIADMALMSGHVGHA